MTGKPKKAKRQLTVLETVEIAAMIDAQAEREGVDRADILRRAIRNYIFSLPDSSVHGTNPQTNPQAA